MWICQDSELSAVHHACGYDDYCRVHGVPEFRSVWTLTPPTGAAVPIHVRGHTHRAASVPVYLMLKELLDCAVYVYQLQGLASGEQEAPPSCCEGGHTLSASTAERARVAYVDHKNNLLRERHNGSADCGLPT